MIIKGSVSAPVESVIWTSSPSTLSEIPLKYKVSVRADPAARAAPVRDAARAHPAKIAFQFFFITLSLHSAAKIDDI